MPKDLRPVRRVRVERNIYRRSSGVYEIGFKDVGGKQRWRTVEGGITAARALRDELLTRRHRGERVASDARLRLADAAEKWLDGPVRDLRPRTQECYRNAVQQHLLPALGRCRLDSVSPDDLALLVRELRQGGLGIQHRDRYRRRQPHLPIRRPTTRLVRHQPSLGAAPIRATEAIPGEAAQNLRRTRARADNRRSERAIPNALHAGRALGAPASRSYLR